MASYNLQKPFLEVCKIAQMYHFWLGGSGSVMRVHANSLPDERWAE